MNNPFIFKSELWIPKYTGIKVYSINEFIKALKEVDKFSIFYHMYINIFNYHNLPTFYTNSISYWFFKNGYLLLAEKLSIIDPLDYFDLEELRIALINILEKNYDKNWNRKEKYPFYFITAEREIIECGKIAHNLDEFIEGIKKSSINSLFYHLITSRIENKTIINDYSAWLYSIGEAKKAEKINKLDPYTLTLYEIKEEIIKILEEKIC
ncbi:hypothetical protein TOPB45_0483 [Thermodesulfobacterium geofontis OPF15]|jgi:hypothetical protein|uniref:Uncharacterized protein n=1 Tax=Thermodesulfobacterium geofontis (strain OPF15) TaxID=795359 RepID=F8C484_THEGP|nr:DUF5752 family protein [Thermodesulfobacterium geofontis]AEH22585.1 hypothetical protein TOPB45_0483 [Thermodesulfobacterium geofontis OPF15]